MAKRKKKKAACLLTGNGRARSNGALPFLRGLCWSRRSLWAPSALSLLLMRGLLSSAFSSGLCCSPIPM